MRPYETPPMLSGTMQQQMQQLREYLMRTILDMNRRDIIRNDELSRMQSETTAATAAKQTAQQQTLAKPGLKLKDVLETIFSPGSLFINANDINPKELFGFGEWVQIKDRFILAAGDTYAAGNTGGKATHTLTEKELPVIDGRAMFPVFGGHGNYRDGHMYATGGIGSNATGAPSSGTTWPTTYGYGFKFGGNAAHNNMPPYQTFYVWMRVS